MRLQDILRETFHPKLYAMQIKYYEYMRKTVLNLLKELLQSLCSLQTLSFVRVGHVREFTIYI